MHALIAKLESKLDLLRAETAEARADLKAVADQVADLPTRRDLDALKLRWAVIGLLAGVILVGALVLIRGG